MTEEIENLREKYLSYLIPEQFFDSTLRVLPKKLRNDTPRKSNFDKIQSKNFNEGKTYVSKSGKLARERVMTHKPCNCPLKCWQNPGLTKDKLQELFTEFWGMGSVTKRRSFIVRYCSATGNEQRRRRVFSYSLPSRNTRVAVCRRFFCNILDVSFCFISWTLDKKESPCKTHILPDGRGRVGHRKVSQQQFEDIFSTFTGEQVMPSHYGRKNSDKFYFQSSKSFLLFYDKYKKKW